ncbi:MAG: HIG1 domain-containing protein [Rhodobacteraceae bacterium]|nr:HIG1 domain-containing protein [Paracoccaceae bacterium]
MFDVLFYVIVFACFGVVLVLMTGMGGFAKGSGWAKNNANRLMRWRLIAQFVVVLLMVIVMLARQSGGS